MPEWKQRKDETSCARNGVKRNRRACVGNETRQAPLPWRMKFHDGNDGAAMHRSITRRRNAICCPRRRLRPSAQTRCWWARLPREPILRTRSAGRAGLYFQHQGFRRERHAAVPGAARDLCDRRTGAHGQALHQLRLRIENQEIEPAAQQHDHLPLFAVHMRSDVALRFERDQQPLNLILVVRVQEQMRALSRARCRSVQQPSQLLALNQLRRVGLWHG